MLGLQRQVGRLRWMAGGLLLICLVIEGAAGLRLAHSPLWLFYEAHGLDPYLTLVLAGLFYFFYWAEPDRSALALVVALGLLIALVSLCLLPVLSATNHLFIGLGLAFAGETIRRLKRDPRRKQMHLIAILLAISLILMVSTLTLFFLDLTIRLCPTTYDRLLVIADGSIGFQPSFLVGRLFRDVPLLGVLGAAFYNTLLFPLLLLVVVQLRCEKGPHTDVVVPFTVIGLAGFAIYLVFPVVGPVFALTQEYPHATLSIEDVAVLPLAVPDVPRNCMPSLHTAWIVLFWWHARPLARGVRVLVGAYLGITLLTILGLGLHYFYDIVVALPFVAAIQAGCLMAPRGLAVRRWTTCLLNAFLAAGWLLLLRYGVSALLLSPWISGAAALLTMGFAYATEHRLDCTFHSAIQPGGAESPSCRLRGAEVHGEMAKTPSVSWGWDGG